MRRLSRQELLAEARRVASYGLVGAAGLALDAAVFLAISHLGGGRAVSRALSIAAATGLTWALNRRLTFQRSGRRKREELARYAAVAAVAQGTDFTLFLALSAVAPGLHPVLLIPPCAAISASISYTGQRIFTFRPARAAAH